MCAWLYTSVEKQGTFSKKGKKNSVAFTQIPCFHPYQGVVSYCFVMFWPWRASNMQWAQKGRAKPWDVIHKDVCVLLQLQVTQIYDFYGKNTGPCLYYNAPYGGTMLQFLKVPLNCSERWKMKRTVIKILCNLINNTVVHFVSRFASKLEGCVCDFGARESIV